LNIVHFVHTVHCMQSLHTGHCMHSVQCTHCLHTVHCFSQSTLYARSALLAH